MLVTDQQPFEPEEWGLRVVLSGYFSMLEMHEGSRPVSNNRNTFRKHRSKQTKQKLWHFFKRENVFDKKNICRRIFAPEGKIWNF